MKTVTIGTAVLQQTPAPNQHVFPRVAVTLDKSHRRQYFRILRGGGAPRQPTTETRLTYSPSRHQSSPYTHILIGAFRIWLL